MDLLINNDPKIPTDLIILVIWALESFKSVDILLLNAFLSFVFCLVVNTNSCGKLFPLSIFKLIHVVPVLYLNTVSSFFSSISVNFTITLLYSTIYVIYRKSVVPLENCSIVSFDCSKM